MTKLQRASDLSGTTYWTNRYSSEDGSLLEVISPTGETNSFVYDDLDNVKTNRFPDGNLLINYYTVENRLASNALPSGASVHLKYDSAGRITNRVSSIGENASYSYNGNDAITLITDNTGTTTNLYDAAGRLIGINYPFGASIRYGLDSLDRITAITNRASAGAIPYITRYAYDAVGNITNVTDPFGGQTSLEYDRVGRRTKRTLPNGITTDWQYNWRDQITNIVHKNSGSTVLASVAYERAPFGEPTRITREDASYVLLKYDAALRLTNEQHYGSGGSPIETIGYGYDASGTRIRLSNNSGTFTNTVEKGYRVTTMKRQSDGATTDTYAYDTGGRITSLSRSGVTLSLGCNTADQLTTVTNGANWTQYTPDAQGRRTKAADQSGAQRRFLVASAPASDLESPQLIADVNNALKQGYVYLGDQPISRFDSGGSSSRVYYLEDGMGSIIALAPTGSPDPANTTRLFYDGFGSTRGTNGPTPTIPNGTGGDFRFHAAWWESATDLYHLRAREYDPRTGRFLSRDPLDGKRSLPETYHPYAFANNNPGVFKDPDGQENLISLSVGGFIQTLLSTLRTIAVHEVRSQARQMIGSAVANFVVKELLAEYVPNPNWKGFLQKGIFAGNKFTEAGRKAFCGVLEDSEWGGKIHFEVNLKNKGPKIGDPDDNGVGCSPNANWDGKAVPLAIKAGHSRPDFIIGDPPFVDVGVYRDAYIVGDFKLTTGTLYRDYISPKSNIDQFNAIRAFAKEHTISHTAVFIVLSRNPKLNKLQNKAQIQYMKKILSSRLGRKGVIGGIVVIRGT